MQTNPLPLKLNDDCLITVLQEAANRLKAEEEIELNFSSVRRVDARAMRELESLAHMAEEKSVKVVMTGVNADIYKALKLARLTKQFSFAD